ASAVEDTSFDCVTDPPFPGLSTRTGMFLFVAPSWEAADSATAPCSFELCCFATWMPIGSEPQPQDSPLRDGSWSELWSVELSFDAVAVDETEFACFTLPSLPGLRTRTEMFVFVGLTCDADDSAMPSCSLLADWSDVWIPDPDPAWLWRAS